MQIVIFNRQQFFDLMIHNNINDENVENQQCTFFIEICDNDGEHSIPYFQHKHSNVLIQHFDDVDEDMIDPISKKLLLTMNSTQAKQMFDFIKTHKNKDQCIIHCSAGISRSGAIGTFIDEYVSKENNCENIIANFQTLLPNNTVLQLLKKEWEIDKLLNS